MGFQYATGSPRRSKISDSVGRSKMADSDEESSINLTGFLFGNINERGELEDSDLLDEVRNELS